MLQTALTTGKLTFKAVLSRLWPSAAYLYMWNGRLDDFIYVFTKEKSNITSQMRIPKELAEANGQPHECPWRWPDV